jgi:hypothetical protein
VNAILPLSRAAFPNTGSVALFVSRIIPERGSWVTRLLWEQDAPGSIPGLRTRAPHVITVHGLLE